MRTRHGKRHVLTITLIGVVLMATQIAVARDDWRLISSVEDVVGAFPEHVKALFEALDLDRPGLEAVRGAYAAADLVVAGEALLAYYRGSDSGHWLRKLEPATEINDAHLREADDALSDIYHGFGDRGQIPRRSDGHLDWSHQGPNRDRQYALRVNRHQFVSRLLAAYQATGNPVYMQRLDEDLRDWLIAADGQVVPYREHTSLEPSLRLPVWALVFYALQDEPRFHQATRLLMLMTLPDHADYIIRDLKRNHNWATMQMNGLGTLGLAFPEFRDAAGWWQFARREMAREIQGQIYPDGAQIELTAGYHMVALNRFGALLETAARAGESMDAAYAGQVEKMYGYLADVIRPDGYRPNNSNSDMGKVDRQLLEAAALFDRADWRYIATNGSAGERPADPPSRFLPWAGQLISRSGWGADAHWSFFDIGPLGSNDFHAHRDNLHLSIDAHGRHLLIDTGRFAYTGSLASKFFSPYAKHSRSQNVILIDGKSQGRPPAKASSPIGDDRFRIADDHDWAMGDMGDFDGLSGHATHTRAVYYQRGEYWIVVDRIETDRPRTIQPLWHFHPDCTVEAAGTTVLTTDSEVGNLRIVPAGNVDWQLALIRGQESPHPMGWYSPTYGHAQPTTVAVYTANLGEGVSAFAWLMLPAGGDVPEVRAELVDVTSTHAAVRVRIGDADARDVRVHLK